MKQNKNNEFDFKEFKDTDINRKVKNIYIKFFSSYEGQLLLKYLEYIFQNKYVDFNNSNLTYFNLGKIEAIKVMKNYLNMLIKEK